MELMVNERLLLGEQRYGKERKGNYVVSDKIRKAQVNRERVAALVMLTKHMICYGERGC